MYRGTERFSSAFFLKKSLLLLRKNRLRSGEEPHSADPLHTGGQLSCGVLTVTLETPHDHKGVQWKRVHAEIRQKHSAGEG